MCLTLLPIMAEDDNSDLSVCYRTVVIIIIDATTKRSRERVDISDFLPLLRLLLLLLLLLLRRRRRRRRFPIFPLSVAHLRRVRVANRIFLEPSTLLQRGDNRLKTITTRTSFFIYHCSDSRSYEKKQEKGGRAPRRQKIHFHSTQFILLFPSEARRAAVSS